MEARLTELLRRVEAATGPDSALAADIYAALGQHPKSGPFPRIPDYTASVDAALALMERLTPELRLTITFDPQTDPRQDRSATAALAILEGLLRALIAESHPAEPLKHMPA